MRTHPELDPPTNHLHNIFPTCFIKCVPHHTAGPDETVLLDLDGVVPLKESLRDVGIDLHDVPDRHLRVVDVRCIVVQIRYQKT